MAADEQLKAAARAFSRAASIAEVQRLVDIWAPRFHSELDSRVISGPRPSLGMNVATIPGRGGMTARMGDSYFVGIGNWAEAGEKRFVLAHEFAHVVLNSNPGRLELDTKTEERLCNRFAGRTLMPPAKMREHFQQAGFPRALADIIRFARRFRTTLRASLAALDEFVPAEWPTAFVAASWREHPRGDGVEGMRIDTSASDGRLFFPRDCRLSTLGYSSLESWALDAPVGKESHGEDAKAAVKSKRPGVSGWNGASRWTAKVQFAPGSQAESDLRGVLCCVSTDRLIPMPPKSRRPRPQWSTPKAPDIIPGQLGMAH